MQRDGTRYFQGGERGAHAQLSELGQSGILVVRSVARRREREERAVNHEPPQAEKALEKGQHKDGDITIV